MSDDIFSLKRNEGSYLIPKIDGGSTYSGSKTEELTDSSISSQVTLENTAAEIHSRSNKTNSQVKLASLLRQNKSARTLDFESTTDKVPQGDSAENELKNVQAIPNQLLYENRDRYSTQSINVQMGPTMDAKNMACGVSASQSKEVLHNTNMTMMTDEKNHFSTTGYLKAEVKAYVSCSKKTMHLEKKVYISAKNFKSMFEKSFKIVEVICNKNKNGEVHSILNREKIKEAVAFYSDRNPRNIKAVAKDLAACGGLALFVKGQCLTYLFTF